AAREGPSGFHSRGLSEKAKSAPVGAIMKMRNILFVLFASTLLAGSAMADCTWGVDPTTGQWTQVCGGDNSGGGGCTWGVDPTTGQWTQVCGLVEPEQAAQ